MTCVRRKAMTSWWWELGRWIRTGVRHEEFKIVFFMETSQRKNQENYSRNEDINLNNEWKTIENRM